jgi:hypothetical protein
MLGRLFEPEFNYIGGEDTHMFLRSKIAGLKMVWADDAVCSERIPSQRATRSWILKRAFRGGTSASICETAVARSSGARNAVRLKRLSRGAAHVAIGLLQACSNLVRFRQIGTLHSARRVCTGAGMILGAFGIGYLEYRRPGENRFRRFSVAHIGAER